MDQTPYNETETDIRVVREPWDRTWDDGVVHVRIRYWLVVCEPWEPTPPWPELWDRVRAGDRKVVELWPGEDDDDE